MSEKVAGVVLAGGLSSRLGGGDKPLLRMGAKTLLDHVVARLSPQVDAMALNANGDPARFARYRLPVLADPVDGNPGPLAGVLAGMEWAARLGNVETLVTVAGDTPFFPDDLVTKLAVAAAHEPRKAAVARSGGRLHPVFARWPVALRNELAAFLTRGQTFRATAFLEQVGFTPVDFGFDEGFDPFFNINTEDDLEAARQRMAGLREGRDFT